MIDENDGELDRGHGGSMAWRPRFESLRRNERILAPVLLAAVVLVFVAGRLILVSRIASPQLLCNEFVYAEVSRSIAEHGSPLLRGLPSRQNML